MKKPLNPKLVGALKYAVALTLLGFVLSKIDRATLVQAVQRAHIGYVLAGFVLLHAAQAISAMRMRYYLHRAGAAISLKKATRLYYIGMFYNTVLPSGVGGDGYKVYLLKKQIGFGVKKGVRVMLSERASGLLVLLWFLFALLPLSPVFERIPLGGWLVGLSAFGTGVAYHIGVRLLCKESFRTSLGALPYSLGVQAVNLLVGAAVLVALGQQAHWAGMLVLFNLAAVLGAVLPISIGGLGVRELTFLYGAQHMGVAPEQGVAFALLWYVVYVAVACAGLFSIRHTANLLHGETHGRPSHPDA